MHATPAQIRVALIGFGLGGACFHAPLIACTPGMRLAAIVTSNAARRAQALRAHPGSIIVDSAQAIWDQAHLYDLVVVATRNDSHVPLAHAALAHGLSVVVDKPCAVSAAGVHELIGAAAQRKLLFTVYHNRRWDSELLTVKRLLAAGQLGEVLRFESRLERWRPSLLGGWRELDTPGLAGGLLYDLGTHLIDQALHLFGPVSQVYAELDQRRAGAKVDDDVYLALTHGNGVRSHLVATVLSALPAARMRVLGSRATYCKMHLDPQEQALRAGGRPDTPDWGVEPPEHWGVLSSAEGATPVRSEPGAYQRFYAGIVASLREGTPPPVDPVDAATGLEIIAAAQRSHAERRVVLLP